MVRSLADRTFQLRPFTFEPFTFAGEAHALRAGGRIPDLRDVAARHHGRAVGEIRDRTHVFGALETQTHGPCRRVQYHLRCLVQN